MYRGLLGSKVGYYVRSQSESLSRLFAGPYPSRAVAESQLASVRASWARLEPDTIHDAWDITYVEQKTFDVTQDYSKGPRVYRRVGD